MTNRERVINGIIACIDGDCEHCPYCSIEPRKEFWDDGLPVCHSDEMRKEALELIKGCGENEQA